MLRLSRLIFLFGLVSAVFFIAPAFLGDQFALFPLMKIGDVFDIFTPLVIIPLYWLLYNLGQDRKLSTREGMLFLLFVALWVEGQGMHLSANSIGHLLADVTESDVYVLTHFYDEVLSHYLWHLGIVGLATLLLIRQWRNPFFTKERWSSTLVVLAGVIYGFTFFLIIIEGGTAPLGIPFAIVVTLAGLIWGRKNLSGQPLLAFFLVSFGVATLLFGGWAIYWGGLPQFSEIGII